MTEFPDDYICLAAGIPFGAAHATFTRLEGITSCCYPSKFGNGHIMAKIPNNGTHIYERALIQNLRVLDCSCK